MTEYYRIQGGVVAVYEFDGDFYAARCFLDNGKVCRSSYTVPSDSRQVLLRHIQRVYQASSTPIDAHRVMALLTLEQSK